MVSPTMFWERFVQKVGVCPCMSSPNRIDPLLLGDVLEMHDEGTTIDLGEVVGLNRLVVRYQLSLDNQDDHI